MQSTLPKNVEPERVSLEEKGLPEGPFKVLCLFSGGHQIITQQTETSKMGGFPFSSLSAPFKTVPEGWPHIWANVVRRLAVNYENWPTWTPKKPSSWVGSQTPVLGEIAFVCPEIRESYTSGHEKMTMRKMRVMTTAVVCNHGPQFLSGSDLKANFLSTEAAKVSPSLGQGVHCKLLSSQVPCKGRKDRENSGPS